MAPIPLKAIVSVSSEDTLHPARNLLCPGSGRKWLCSLDNKDRRVEVVVELSKRARITAIDITNCGSAFVEVAVSSGNGSAFITLLPQSMLMTVSDSRAKRNRTRTVSYKREKLSATAASQKWNRVKISCRQPYNLSEQFGLQYIAFYSISPTQNTPTTPTSHSHLLTPPLTPTLLSPPPSSALTHRQASSTSTPPARIKSEYTTPKAEPQNRQNDSESVAVTKLPALTPQNFGMSDFKSSATPGKQTQTAKTPRRPLREKDGSETSAKGEEDEKECEVDFEFSGLEKQSRLFKNALRGKLPGSSEQEANPILEKIMREKEKYQKMKQEAESISNGASYSRKKLLQRELPKADTSADFVASFKEGAHSSKDMASAWKRMSMFDNRCEIGDEPESPWSKRRGEGRRKRGKRGRNSGPLGGYGGWLKKQRKLEDMISNCGHILGRAGVAGEERKEETLVKATSECDDANHSDTDSDATMIDEEEEERGGGEGGGGRGGGGERKGRQMEAVLAIMDDGTTLATFDDPQGIEVVSMECPLCGGLFPEYAIEVHASTCGTTDRPICID